MGNCNCNCNRKTIDNNDNSDQGMKLRRSAKPKSNLESSNALTNETNDDAKSDVSSLTMVNLDGLVKLEQASYEDEQYLGDFDLQPSAAGLIQLEAVKISEEYVRQQAIERAGQKGSDLELIEKEWKDDKDVVLTAVKNNGRALQFASETLKADKEVVLAAVTNYAAALEYASTALKSDMEIVGTALKDNGLALVHCSDTLKANTEIVTIAITTNGSALEYAHEDIRRDKNMVLLAVENNPLSLRFAMGGLNEDKDCLDAVGLKCNEHNEHEHEATSVA